MALRFSGRFSVTQAMPPSTSTLTVLQRFSYWLIVVSLYC